MMFAVGHAPVSAVVPSTRATLPAVADIFVVPVASGVGNAAPVAPLASATKYDPPGGIDAAAGSGATIHVVPIALPYCTERPASANGAFDGLKSSTKSRLNGAPALPPPP